MRVSIGLFVLAFSVIASAKPVAGSATTSRFECPSELSPAAAPASGDWQLRASDPQDTSTHKLLNPSLFDGPPEELASLAPDIDNPPPTPSVWKLNPKTDRYWIGCLYEGTKARYAVNLPKGFGECSTFDQDGKRGFTCGKKPSKRK